MTYRIRTRDEHYTDPGPKRILAVDGGGLRGIFSLELLKRIEDILKSRHGEDFRLGHYFDLLSGTSTGSVIAASLALGMSVDEVRAKYDALGRGVFTKTLLRKGLTRAKYDKNKLVTALQDTFGADTRMNSEKIQSGLLVMTKRRDTGSPWPITNNPAGKYFSGNEKRSYIPNGEYPLWSVVRASTAAPAFFKGERIEIARQPGMAPVVGEFVDGGVSPFNNPALQAFMYATLEGHRVRWPTGPERILLVSVGTGSRDPGIPPATFSLSSPIKSLASMTEASQAVKSLVSMMDDCNALVQTMLQWMSSGPSAETIDSEMGDLSGDLLAPQPLMSYIRYNMELSGDSLAQNLDMHLDAKSLKKLAKMDVPDNMPILSEIGREAAARLIDESHFPAVFDLPDTPVTEGSA